MRDVREKTLRKRKKRLSTQQSEVSEVRKDDAKDSDSEVKKEDENMGDSKAYKKLKEEEDELDREHRRLLEEAEKYKERPVWVFTVFKNPPGLKVDHFGDVLNLSYADLKEVAEGKVNMAYYPSIPKNEYRAFMLNVCDALDLVYRPYMLERITPEVMPKARVEFPEKKIWDKALEESEALKTSIRITKGEIARLEEFFKAVKKK